MKPVDTLQQTSVSDFIKRNYRHFNAAALKDAAESYIAHLDKNGFMLVTLGGAMSTAEIGLSLAEMIRQNKVHAISATGANLEEDIFNLVAHSHYERIPDYRYLSTEEELRLHAQGLNRVTDTCIPEEEAMRRIERLLLERWQVAIKEKQRYFPYEFIYQLIREGALEPHYEIDPKNSWVVAAAEKNLPVFTPGWEDSTLGNMFVAQHLKGNVSDLHVVKSGLEQMAALIDWYKNMTRERTPGFFQIGGGISGDFPICVVPLIQQDLKQTCKLWGYFCQISESKTSYGSYSGAVPNEKISWGKLAAETPRFVIESDATIVVPLIFAYVLGK